MKTKQLPQGWKEVKLEEVINLKGGYAFKSSEFVNEGMPIIRIANFNNNFVDISKAVKYPIQKADDYLDYKLETNDLLIAMSGATTGKIGIVSKQCLPCLLNQRVGKFDILNEKELDWKFLLFIIKSNSFQKEVYGIASGCAQPNISGKQIESIKIPLPPLPTQKKIVQILEQAEQLKQKREQADKLMNDYLKSVFNEMFLKKGFEKVELGEICNTSSGGTPSRSKKEYWENGKIPWIKSGDLNKNQIFGVDEFITEEGLKESSAKYVDKNTILIAMYGATAGKTSISKIKATTNQAVCAINPKNENLNEIYLLYLLRSMYSYIVSLSFGGGQPNISQQVIRSLKIPLPPLALQKKFALIVEKVEKIKQAQKKSKQEIDNLFNALMQKAFKGELV